MEYLYYCPKCNYESNITNKDIPKDIMINVRGGYGIPICHFKCPKCGNLYAGAMMYRGEYNDDIKEYYRHTIGIYQNIRTK